MKIVHPNSYNSLNSNADWGQQSCAAKNQVSFKGIESAFGGGKRVAINHYDDVVKFLNSKYGKFIQNLEKDIPTDVFNKVFEGKAIHDESMGQKFVNSFLYPFTGMWKDLYGGVVGGLAKKFPKNLTLEKWSNAEFLQKHRNNKVLRDNVQSLRGALEEVNKIYGEILAKNNGVRPDDFEELVVKQTDELLRNYMSKKTGNYSTPVERSLNRLVTGLVPAFFLAIDVYNMSLRNGMTKKEAKASANQRLTQEFIRAGGTAYSTYGTLNTFDRLTNTFPRVAPVITTGTVAIVESGSRLAVGKNLIPEKLPPQPQRLKNITSINQFLHRENNEQLYWLDSQEQQNQRKHLLTLKNAMIFVAASVIGGFACRYGKQQILKTDFGKNILKQRDNWIDKYFKVKLNVNAEDMEAFIGKIQDTEFSSLAKRYRRTITAHETDILRDRVYRFNKIDKLVKIPFTNMEVPLIEVAKVVFVPFRLVKDLALIPYKLVSSVVLTVAQVSKTKIGNNIAKFLGDSKKPSDELAMLSTAYQNYLRKAPNLDDKEFAKYMENSVRAAFNKNSNSAIDNSKIGKMTKNIVSMVTLYFVVLDDYILTLKQTKSQDQASQKGRERFVQNIMRMAVQLSLMDLFNDIFRLQYNNSLAGAMHIAFWNTIATDIITRKLVGKPITPMSKEKQELHEQKTTNGIAGKYHKFISRLAN